MRFLRMAKWWQLVGSKSRQRGCGVWGWGREWGWGHTAEFSRECLSLVNASSMVDVSIFKYFLSVYMLHVSRCPWQRSLSDLMKLELQVALSLEM